MPARLAIPGSDLLAAALKERELTYEAAARKLGTSDTLVSMLVNRQRAPGRKVALALRDELGIPIDAPWPIRRSARPSPLHPSAALSDHSPDLGVGSGRRRSLRKSSKNRSQ